MWDELDADECAAAACVLEHQIYEVEGLVSASAQDWEKPCDESVSDVSATSAGALCFSLLDAAGAGLAVD